MAEAATKTLNRNFVAYWTAVGTSQLGSAVNLVVVPLVAVVTLRAGPVEMAWLAVMGTLPVLVIRIPAAMFADRLTNRVPYMIGCNLAQAAIVGAIPLLWWLDALTMPLLLGLQALASAALGVYASLSTPVVVQIVPKERLVDANGKLNTTRSVADISGSAISGGLLAILAVPLVLLVDCVSFLLSALLLRRITLAPREQAEPGTRPKHDLGALARFLAPRSGLQALVLVSLVQGVVETILVLYLVHDLRIAPSLISVLISLGAVGGVCGGLAVGFLLEHVGPAYTMTLSALVMIVSMAGLPFAGPGLTGVAAVVLYQLTCSFAGTVLVSTVFGTLQGEAPGDRVAQVMAMASTCLQIGGLAGAGLGGLLSGWFSLRAMMGIAAVAMLAGLLVQITRWLLGRG
ncbi:MFS transporter [Nonomuraea purpurea]|uniref:MFS transporter n=1 Tax=Nonomuraea purpurea TaxID=1849276 RepID=A0ABV8G545_9ACTN